MKASYEYIGATFSKDSKEEVLSVSNDKDMKLSFI